MIIISKRPAQTRLIGYCLGQIAVPGDIIFLDGELGSGKTELVKGVLEGRNLTEYKATSPSFIIEHIYQNSSGNKVVHLDLYKVEEFEHIKNEISEYLNDSIIIVEWGDKIEGLVNCSINVKLDYCFEKTRIIHLSFSNKQKEKNFKTRMESELLCQTIRYNYTNEGA